MRIRTPENQNGQALPVMRLVSSQGQRVEIPSSGSTFTPTLQPGVYMLNTTTDVFMRLGPVTTVGEFSGSFFFPAGASAFFRMSAGDRVSVRAASGPGSLFVIPAEVA